jgi:O-antigen ligase
MGDLGNWLVENTWLLTSVAALGFSFVVFVLASTGRDWAPILVMATVPIQREMLVGKDDVHVTVTQLTLAAFFAGAALLFASGRLSLRIDAVTIWMGIVVSIYGLSVMVSPDVAKWTAETYRWAVAAVFFVVARAYFSSETRMRLLGALGVGILFAATVAIAQVVLDDGPASFVRSGLVRAHGWFGEPNPFAAFVWCLTLPVLAFAALSGDRRRELRLLSALAGAVGLLALVLTQSRGGVLGAGAGICVIAAVLLGRERRKMRVAAGITAALVASFAIVLIVVAPPWSGAESATTPDNWADQERSAHWAAAVKMVEERPYSGVGAGEFSDQYRTHTPVWRFRISQGHAHNAYLQLAAEVGLPGMFAYVLMLAAIFGAMIQRARTEPDGWLPIGVVAMTVALLAHQMVDFLHVLSLGLLFAGLWAATLPSGNKGKSSREHNFAS